jgi:hypothetical protein
MKKALLILMMALTPALVAAQEAKEQQAPPAPANLAVKAFQVKPGNLERIRDALNMIVGLNNVKADENLNVLVVKTTQQLMPAVEEIVKRLDVAVPPPRNIEFTIYLLEVAREPLAENVIPADLQSTVTQLRTALGYQGFRVADRTIVQARPGDPIQYSGNLQVPQGQAPAPRPQNEYALSFRTKLLPEEKPPVIQIDQLRLYGLGHGDVLRTSVDVREGQKVVVGKAAANQQNLVLVISAKLLN